jgi:septal ring factor EnvC (AmiA/AmiB activator)
MFTKYIYLGIGVVFAAVVAFYSITISGLHDEIAQDNITISKLNDVITSQDRAIKEVKETNTANDKVVSKLRKRISVLNGTIAELHKNSKITTDRCNNIIASMKKDINVTAELKVNECKIYLEEISDEDYIGSNINRIGL